MRIFSKDNIKFLVLIIIILTGIYISFHFNLEEKISLEMIRNFIQNAGIWGPLLYILLYCITSVVFFPATLLSTASGAVWGPYIGTLYTVIGATIASSISFFISRLLGRKVSQKIFNKSSKISVCDRFIGKNAFVVVLIMRFIPIIPWDVVNFGSGLCDIRFRSYFLASLIGTIPATFTYNLIGSSIGQPLDKTKIVAVAVTVSSLVIVSLIYKKVILKRKNNGL